jgi:hypothetical protein
MGVTVDLEAVQCIASLFTPYRPEFKAGLNRRLLGGKLFLYTIISVKPWRRMGF